MFGHYIAGKTFSHKIDCFCSGGHHADVLKIQKGDLINVTNERKFTMHGWYFLVGFNDICMFYMALADLEQYFIKEQLLTMLDIDLKINYYQFKINQALDTGDEASFMNFTKEFKEFSALKERLEQYVSNVAV